MCTADAAEHLRQRAMALRRFAAEIEITDAVTLWRQAGGDVWIGPTADACGNDLRLVRGDLLGAVDGLRAAARRFDHESTVLATMPALSGPR